MLFIHDRLPPKADWMKNTRIPPDILYFDDQRRLVSQQRDVPPCSAGNRCPSYPSSAPARYVLELNAGKAMEIGLQDGAELHFGPGIHLSGDRTPQPYLRRRRPRRRLAAWVSAPPTPTGTRSPG